MEDSKCMICKQECPQVFFTRYMGDYTEGLAPDEFVDLPVSCGCKTGGIPEQRCAQHSSAGMSCAAAAAAMAANMNNRSTSSYHSLLQKVQQQLCISTSARTSSTVTWTVQVVW
jgi:hypothetical protein